MLIDLYVNLPNQMDRFLKLQLVETIQGKRVTVERLVDLSMMDACEVKEGYLWMEYSAMAREMARYKENQKPR